MNHNQQTLEELRWQKFPVTSDGFVCLVDCMGDDAAVIQAARVSYGKDCRNENTPVTQPGIEFEDRMKKEDENLLRYLMRHRHSTPFEMAEVKILVRVPMDCWRQWIRHRTANVNEYSTRYTEAIDSRQTTKPDEWRLQSQSNKQGSSGDVVTRWPMGSDEMISNSELSPGEFLTEREEELHKLATLIYEERLEFGVAKEVARKDLPLSTYTEAYWKCDLHNIFHFLSLRMDSHAQKEIRDYATTIGEQIIKPLFPIAYKAFMDYRFNAMTLSELDIEFIRLWIAVRGKDNFYNCAIAIFGGTQLKPTREAQECYTKLCKLDLI
jgi:thymidylate synthase (FAD)